MPVPQCNGICERLDFGYKTTGKIQYANGYRLCSACRKSIQCSLIKCPCCNVDLRRKPRHSTTRRKVLDEVKRY
jgi:hypothetical protein